MGLILSIETAISVCSVALHEEEGRMVAIAELFQENVHAQKVMPLIDTLLQQAGVRKDELCAVAVSSGPGSYTGLRIGVSTAKGLAYALGIPLIGVDTLDALACRALPFMAAEDLVVPMVDARRMEVYCKVLSGEMEELLPLAPLIVDEYSFESYLSSRKLFFLGDANVKVREVIKHEHAVFVPLLNSAETVGKVAVERYRESRFEDVAYFEPNYLKEFRVLKSKKSLLL
jgi:tRNA threonylcarbamoyladenosine biosynthesis protein TsaB